MSFILTLKVLYRDEKKRFEERKISAKRKANTLSFRIEEEEEESESIVNNEKQEEIETITEYTTQKKQKVMKNPDIDTSFLPDKELEEKERLAREQIKREWLEEQERIKGEEIEITYSYWTGVGNRSVIKVKKGTTIETFLYKVQQEWKDLKRIGMENLLFVKEDFIIPHHYSFYDLILMHAKGRTGNLFDFDVHEDVRLVNDAKKEKDETHAAKVLDKRFFQSHKHEFPYNKWVTFDPEKHVEKKE